MARHAREVDLAFRVVVFRVDVPFAHARLRASRLAGAGVLFRSEPRKALLRRLALAHGGRPLDVRLRMRGAEPAGTDDDAPRFERRASVGESVEEFAVVAHEDPDAAVARKRAGELRAGLAIDVVRRLVEHEGVRSLPERNADLELLLFAAGQLMKAPGHVVFDAHDAPDLACLAPEIRREVEERFGLDVGLLGAEGGIRNAGNRARIGFDDAAGDFREGRFAAAVIAEQTGPALREGDGDAVQHGFGGSGIGVRDAGKGYLHGIS